jgi:hypothetical protein
MANAERGPGGKFTSLFKKSGDSGTPETAGVDTPSAGEGPGAAAVGDARAEAAAGLEKRRGRGRPSNASREADARVAGKPSAAQPAKSNIPPEVAAQLEAMYSPDIWEPVVEMPFAAGQLITGHDFWELSEKEKRVLSVSGSTAARYLGFTNPKWLAINLFLINLMTITAPRLLKELAIKRMEKAERAKKKPEPNPDASKN